MRAGEGLGGGAQSHLAPPVRPAFQPLTAFLPVFTDGNRSSRFHSDLWDLCRSMRSPVDPRGAVKSPEGAMGTWWRSRAGAGDAPSGRPHARSHDGDRGRSAPRPETVRTPRTVRTGAAGVRSEAEIRGAGEGGSEGRPADRVGRRASGYPYRIREPRNAAQPPAQPVHPSPRLRTPRALPGRGVPPAREGHRHPCPEGRAGEGQPGSGHRDTHPPLLAASGSFPLGGYGGPLDARLRAYGTAIRPRGPK